MTNPDGRDALPPIVALADMREIFPRSWQTINRWSSRADSRGKKLPMPELRVALGKTPLWRLDVIIEWAESHDEKVNQNVIERIRREQARPDAIPQ